MVKELKDAFAILKQDKYKIAAVSSRDSATNFGIIFLAVPAVVNLFLSSLLYPSGFGAIFTRFVFWSMLIPLISLVGAIFMVSIVAEKFFRPSVSHLRVFRVMSYAGIFMWLTILPFLLDVLGLSLGFGLYNIIWMAGFILMLAAAYQLLSGEYKLQQKDIIICLASSFVAYFVLNYFLGSLLIGVGYRIFY